MRVSFSSEASYYVPVASYQATTSTDFYVVTKTKEAGRKPERDSRASMPVPSSLKVSNGNCVRKKLHTGVLTSTLKTILNCAPVTFTV